MLHTQAKNYYSYPILGNDTSSFYHLYNAHSDHPHRHQLSLSESSLSRSTFPYDPNYLQNQESNSVTTIEIETKEQSPSLPRPLSFIKKILAVDDDPALR
jgi:hypothetical protein